MTRAPHRPKLQRCTFVPFTAPRARTPRKRPTQSFHRLTAALLALAACILIPACKPATGPDPLNRSALTSERKVANLEAAIDDAITQFGTLGASDKQRLSENLGAMVYKFHPAFAGGMVQPPLTGIGFAPDGGVIAQTTISHRAIAALADFESKYDSEDARRVILQIRDRAEAGMTGERGLHRRLFDRLDEIIRVGNMEEESK